MGWRFRKSINLGLGFRINLSKSGIGYSWGFPGYRVTKLANGQNRTTYSIPGTGISYVEQQRQGKTNNGKGDPQYDASSNLITGEKTIFENKPIDDITKNDPILKEINKALFINRLANLLILIGLIVFLYPVFIVSLIAGIIIKIIIITSMNTKLYYEFDDESRKMYNALKEIWIELSMSRKLWQINSSVAVYNRKYNSGAGTNIIRSPAYITSRLPFFIKTNIDIYGLNLQNQKIFFTPDRILVFKPFRKVFGCTYRDMFLGIESSRMVEHYTIPRDAVVDGYTWRYTNVDGSRDLRFSHNRRYPVCKYGELIFRSPNGINTIIDFSNHNMAEDIQSKLVLFGNQFNKILALSKSDNISNSLKQNINNIDSLEKEGLEFDPLFSEVLSYSMQNNKISAALIQRKFKIDYARASNLIDYLEEKNIIGPYNGSGLREVLISNGKDGE